jgi:LPXTG-motif cell wall-anchored protein
MDSTTMWMGIGFVVALGLYLMRRRSRVNKDDD